MTIGEIATVIVPTAITAGMYLYLLGERRKLHEARRRGHLPAE
jgi:hypothetical protein